MRALVEVATGVVTVDLVEEEVVAQDVGAALPRTTAETGLPLVVDADASGPTVIAVVDRRPPLVISRDAGATWTEAGAGLPPGRAVAISDDHPDWILFGSASRLHISRDGGRFWHALGVELDDVQAVAWPPAET